VNDGRRKAITSDIIQNAAAGTSLIGHSVISRIVGQLAVNSAASAPVARPETCTPSTKVKRTSSALDRGVTMNAPQLPPIFMNIAISSGSPGA
jgi:hypothetical protein